MAEVKIVVVADDESSEVVQRIRQEFERLGDTGSRSGATIQSSFARAQGAVAGVSGIVSTAIAVTTKYELTQLSLQNAHARVAEAQRDLNNAISAYGPNSEQAIEASVSLATAQRSLERAQTQAHRSNLMLGVATAGLVLQIPGAVSGVIAFTKALRAMAVAGQMAAIGATAGIAAVGIAAGTAVVIASNRELDSSVRDTEDSYRSLGATGVRSLQQLDVAGRTFDPLKPFQDMDPGRGRTIQELQNQRRQVKVELDALAAEFNRDPMSVGVAARIQELSPIFDNLGLSIRRMRSDAVEAFVDISRLPLALQENLRGSGIETTFLRDVVQFEQQLARTSGEARDALLAQAAAVKDKSGDTLLLNKLLADGAINEAEYETAISQATQALDKQTASVSRAGQARSSAGRAGVQQAITDLAAWEAQLERTASSVDRAQRGPNANLLDPFASISRGLNQVLSTTTFNRGDASSPRSHGFDFARVANAKFTETVTARQALLAQVQALALREPGLANHPDVLRAIGMFGGSSSHHMRRILQSIRGFRAVFAAEGFDGVVTKPTMFVAGEAGREHVRVTPGGRGGETINITVNAPGGNPATVAAGVRLGIQQARHASRRF